MSKKRNHDGTEQEEVTKPNERTPEEQARQDQLLASTVPADISPDPSLGTFETEQQRLAREEREAQVAESGGTTTKSAVNPRKDANKDPVYAGGTGPGIPQPGHPGGSVPTDPRVPPENVSVNRNVPPENQASKAVTDTPQATSAQQQTAYKVPTAEEAGLPEPHLRAGLDPLPEEEPTPSTVPIPPPGPRRVA